MKINRAKSKDMRPMLQDLDCGDVFIYQGDYYIKVFWHDSGKHNPFGATVKIDPSCQHAVMIGNGQLVPIPREAHVKQDRGEYVPSG